MGVKGKRSLKLSDEPTLLRNIEDIISKAREKGFINNYQVDIKEIVKSHGVILREESMPSSLSGYLRFIDQKWVIGVNSKHHPKRQRYTIAHEFAHYILHRDDRGEFEDEEIYFRSDKTSSIEFKADEFAGEILMPDDLFRHAIKNGLKQIEELANAFNVSTLAVKVRAQMLGFKMKANEE